MEGSANDDELQIRAIELRDENAVARVIRAMDAAQALYEKLGFRRIAGAKGATGHHGCDRFYEREL